MNNGQKIPRGHPYFNSYIKNLRVLLFRTDGRMDGDINLGGLSSLHSSRLSNKIMALRLTNITIN
jgi:hypothetical protein